MSPYAPIASPCIKVCFVDPESGLCLGCFRDTDEIANWLNMTPQTRAAVMDALPGRRSLIAPEKLG